MNDISSIRCTKLRYILGYYCHMMDIIHIYSIDSKVCGNHIIIPTSSSHHQPNSISLSSLASLTFYTQVAFQYFKNNFQFYYFFEYFLPFLLKTYLQTKKKSEGKFWPTLAYVSPFLALILFLSSTSQIIDWFIFLSHGFPLHLQLGEYTICIKSKN